MAATGGEGRTHERVKRYSICLSDRYRGRLLDRFRFLETIVKVPEVIIRSSLCTLFKVIKIVAEAILVVLVIFIIIVVIIVSRSGFPP
jgi:hypothetical protein